MENNNNKSWARVRVVVAADHNATWSNEQLHAILAQTGVLVDILILDDKPSDMTADMTADRLANQFGTEQRITVLSQQREGDQTGGRFNHVYRSMAVGGFDYLAFVSPHDIWRADTLASAIRRMEDASADGYTPVSRAGAAARPGKQAVWHAPGRAVDHLFEGAGQGCTVLLRANFFREIQQFCTDQQELVDRLHHHDWLVYILARAWGRRWFFDAASSADCRQQGRPDAGVFDWRASLRQRMAIIRSSWYQHQLRAACAIYTRSGGADAAALRVTGMVLGPRQEKPSIYHRIALAVLLIRHGRRRAKDRMVIGVAALFGWI